MCTVLYEPMTVQGRSFSRKDDSCYRTLVIYIVLFIYGGGVLAPEKKDTARREGKGRRCWLEDVLYLNAAFTNHLAARLI